MTLFSITALSVHFTPFHSISTSSVLSPSSHLRVGRVETETGGTRWRTGGEVKGKEANGVGSQQFSVWLGTVHPVLLQSFSPDPHSKKASTRINWQPRRYKWTGPFRWKTESGFCACAITSRFHSTIQCNTIQYKTIKSNSPHGICGVQGTSRTGCSPNT